MISSDSELCMISKYTGKPLNKEYELLLQNKIDLYIVREIGNVGHFECAEVMVWYFGRHYKFHTDSGRIDTYHIRNGYDDRCPTCGNYCCDGELITEFMHVKSDKYGNIDGTTQRLYFASAVLYMMNERKTISLSKVNYGTGPGDKYRYLYNFIGYRTNSPSYSYIILIESLTCNLEIIPIHHLYMIIDVPVDDTNNSRNNKLNRCINQLSTTCDIINSMNVDIC